MRKRRAMNGASGNPAQAELGRGIRRVRPDPSASSLSHEGKRLGG